VARGRAFSVLAWRFWLCPHTLRTPAPRALCAAPSARRAWPLLSSLRATNASSQVCADPCPLPPLPRRRRVPPAAEAGTRQSRRARVCCLLAKTCAQGRDWLLAKLSRPCCCLAKPCPRECCPLTKPACMPQSCVVALRSPPGGCCLLAMPAPKDVSSLKQAGTPAQALLLGKDRRVGQRCCLLTKPTRPDGCCFLTKTSRPTFQGEL
jgi:hypothetical protein